MQKRILIVEDELSIRTMLRILFEKNDFFVVESGNTYDAKMILANQKIDLMVLDWMLPDMSGVELARLLRKDANYRSLPIIMLTARGTEEDKIHSLNLGCDDYLTKPFSPNELLARIKAMLRRVYLYDEDESLVFGEISLNVMQQKLTLKNQVIKISKTEYKLLEFFMKHPNKIYNRAQLLDKIWENQLDIEERTVDVHIRRLRKLLEPFHCENYIKTVHGSGYLFSLD